MKNVFKYIPFVTVLLFMAMLIITVIDFRSYDMFASVVDGWGKGDILSNFSHIDWNHWMGNSSHLLVMGGLTEILLSIRKKRMVYIGIIVAAVVGHTVISELLNDNGIGASGWLAALPVVAIPTLCWFVGTAKRNGTDIVTHPAWAFSILPMWNIINGLHWDLTMLNSGDGIGHDAHLMGYSLGAALFAIAVPFVVSAWVRKFKAMRAYKSHLTAHRAELRRKLAAQRAEAMAA